MFTNPHNQNLLNDVMRVMNGETTEQPIRPIPQWITEAAVVAAKEITGADKDAVVTLESRRDILRKFFSEAVENCNCEVTKESPLQFEEAVQKAINEARSTVANAVISEAKMGTGVPAGASEKEFAKARAANPNKVRLGKGVPAGAPMKKEEVEVEAELREFLTQLTTEEITTLRNIINETR
jgi:flavin-binding protein dodecin